MEAFRGIPAGYFIHVLVLSFILSLATANFMALMSRERIRAYNVISLLQVVLLFISLSLFLLVFRYREVMAYIYGLYISYIFAFLTGFILIFPYLREKKEGKQPHLLREMFRYGTVMQLGNIFQFLNYRASFYFIEYFINRAAVGVYNVGIQLSESIWLISKSIHLVQFARISNEQDSYKAARLTLGLVKISFLLTLVCIAALIGLLYLCFPLVFRPEFAGIKPVMLVMATGILTFSVSIILSPYFSGMGKPIHNTISAAIGLVFTISATLLLIPRLGLPGGALAASLAYTASTIYQFVVFVRITHVRARDFLLTGKDITAFVTMIRGLRNPV
jgi:O-antigen/teichoic acid export membrane protein